jgi:hypothetical protein
MLLDQAVQEVIFAKIASEHFVKIPNKDLSRKYTHQLVEWLVQFINPEYVEIFCLNFIKLIADNIRNNLKHTKRSDVKAAFLEISREVIGNYILSVGHELEEKLQAENSESAPMDAETEPGAVVCWFIPTDKHNGQPPAPLTTSQLACNRTPVGPQPLTSSRVVG